MEHFEKDSPIWRRKFSLAEILRNSIITIMLIGKKGKKVTNYFK